MAVNSNIGMAFSMRPERQPRDVTIEELLEAVFSLRFGPGLCNEKQLRIWERLETTVRKVGGWCEIASLAVSWSNE
jgi:hypothetical protein